MRQRWHRVLQSTFLMNTWTSKPCFPKRRPLWDDTDWSKIDWSIRNYIDRKKLFSTFIKMFQINSVKLNKHYLTCLLLLLSLSIFYKCDQSFFWWIGFRSINVLSIEPSPPLSVVIRASRGPRKKVEKMKKMKKVLISH